MAENRVSRGEIYFVNLDPVVGSEVNKTRPAVIISNDIQNKVSKRVVVIPITSNTKQLYPFEAPIKVKNNSCKALADQIRTIDKIRLCQYLGQASDKELKDIEKALKIVLSL